MSNSVENPSFEFFRLFFKSLNLSSNKNEYKEKYISLLTRNYKVTYTISSNLDFYFINSALPLSL